MPRSRSSYEHPSRKRDKYTQRACQNCRRRKSKCDGATPCSTCARLNDNCSWGEPPSDAGASYNRSYVLALQHKLDHAEKRLAAIANEEGSSQITEGAGAEDGREHDGEATSGDYALSASAEGLRYDPTSGLLQYGRASVFQHLPDPSPASLLSSQDPGHLVDSVSSGSTHPSPLVPSSWRKNLPHRGLHRWDDQLHDLVVDLFFSYFNNWYHFVDEIAFRRDMIACLGDGPAERTCSYSALLHNAILGFGCWACDDPRTHDHEVSGWLIARASGYFNDEGENPTLSTLQGLLIIGQYYTCANKVNLGYLWAGIALKVSCTLGLEVDCAPQVAKGVMTERSRQARIRTFWTCFLVDKLWSSYVGRAPTIPSSIIEVGLPEIDESVDLQPYAPHPESLVACYPGKLPPFKAGPSFSSTTFHWTSRLALIEDRILTSIYGPRVNLQSSATGNELSAIQLELDLALASFPPFLRITPQTITPPPGHIIILNVFWHFLVILLHRPWCHRRSVTKDLAVADQVHSKCSSSASRIVALLGLYNRLPSMRFATAAIVQFTFSAATTFLLSLARAHKLGQRKKAQTAREALDTCVTYLKMAGNPCVNARQCWTILERLLKEYGLDGAGKGENERARKQGFGKDFEEEARFPSNSSSAAQSTSIISTSSLVLPQTQLNNVSWFLPPSTVPPDSLAPLSSAFYPPSSVDFGRQNEGVPTFPEGWTVDLESILAGSEWTG